MADVMTREELEALDRATPEKSAGPLWTAIAVYAMLTHNERAPASEQEAALAKLDALLSRLLATALHYEAEARAGIEDRERIDWQSRWGVSIHDRDGQPYAVVASCHPLAFRRLLDIERAGEPVSTHSNSAPGGTA